MKKLYLGIFAVTLLLLISACKKEEDPNNNNNNNNNNNTTNPVSTAIGGSPGIPSGAAGAFYAVDNYVIGDDGTGYIDTFELGSAYAWFENYTTTKNAGDVTCNGDALDSEFAGTPLAWYMSSFGSLDVSSNQVAWSVEGNTANGITGFTYTDNTPYSKCNFTVPATVNLNNSLTVTNTNVGSNDAVFYSISTAGKPKVTKAMNANSTSATFTSAELKSVAQPGEMIGIQVMPVKLTKVVKNGKDYYFVKQWAFGQVTATQ